MERQPSRVPGGRALFIRRVARFADFERTRHTWRTHPPKRHRPKLFPGRRGPVRFAFNRAAPATRRWGHGHRTRRRGGNLAAEERRKRRALQGGRARAGMQTASSIVYCGALIAPAPHGAALPWATAPVPGPGRDVMWTSAAGRRKTDSGHWREGEGDPAWAYGWPRPAHAFPGLVACVARTSARPAGPSVSLLHQSPHALLCFGLVRGLRLRLHVQAGRGTRLASVLCDHSTSAVQ